MPLQTHHYSAEETARRGDDLYEQQIRSLVEESDRAKVVAIDVKSGTYAIAENALSASRRLLDQTPNAEIWCIRIGHRALHRMGVYSLRKQA